MLKTTNKQLNLEFKNKNRQLNKESMSNTNFKNKRLVVDLNKN